MTTALSWLINHYCLRGQVEVHPHLKGWLYNKQDDSGPNIQSGWLLGHSAHCQIKHTGQGSGMCPRGWTRAGCCITLPWMNVSAWPHPCVRCAFGETVIPAVTGWVSWQLLLLCWGWQQEEGVGLVDLAVGGLIVLCSETTLIEEGREAAILCWSSKKSCWSDSAIVQLATWYVTASETTDSLYSLCCRCNCSWSIHSAVVGWWFPWIHLHIGMVTSAMMWGMQYDMCVY